MARRAVLALLLALAGASAAAAEVRDYAAGVAKIGQFGLPDVQQAKYVRVTSRGGRSFGPLPGGDDERALSGNAWLLETKADGSVVVLVDQVRTIDMVSEALAEQRRKARAEVDGAEDEEVDRSGTLVGTWQDADLSADIRAITAYLEKAGNSDYALRRNAAEVFLFAAQVHRRGQGAEANRMMSLLFDRVGDSRPVVGAALDRIANVEYEKAFGAFCANGDWAKYLLAMETLQRRFGTAWRNGPVIARVAEAVRTHLAKGPAPALTGEDLTDEDRRIAAMLCHPETVIPARHPVLMGSIWLLQDPAPAVAGSGPGPLDLLQRRGPAAIPLLIALLGDDRLVRTAGEEVVDFSR